MDQIDKDKENDNFDTAERFLEILTYVLVENNQEYSNIKIKKKMQKICRKWKDYDNVVLLLFYEL